MCDENYHLILIGRIQFVPRLRVVLFVPEAANVEQFTARQKGRAKYKCDNQVRNSGGKKEIEWGQSSEEGYDYKDHR